MQPLPLKVDDVHDAYTIVRLRHRRAGSGRTVSPTTLAQSRSARVRACDSEGRQTWEEEATCFTAEPSEIGKRYG